MDERLVELGPEVEPSGPPPVKRGKRVERKRLPDPDVVLCPFDIKLLVMVGEDGPWKPRLMGDFCPGSEPDEAIAVGDWRGRLRFKPHWISVNDFCTVRQT